MDLRRLRYFMAVAEEGHVTRAAERLGMQQPPLSQQIKTLEQELDVRLFRRLPRGVALTDAGKALFTEIRSVLAHLERAVETTRRTARGEQGRLRVGIAPTAPFHPLVPQAIGAFRNRFPLVSLTMEEGLSNEIADKLDSETLDIAFVRNATLVPGGLVVHRLLEEPMIVAMPADHAAGRGRSRAPVALKTFADDRFILIGPPGTGLHDETVAACRAVGFAPRIGQPAPRITSAIALVAAGLGVALVPESVHRLAMSGVVYRRLDRSARPKAFLGLALRRGDPSPVVRQFTALVRGAARR
jgi:DNA-binding transcriptional LysR family regulator